MRVTCPRDGKRCRHDALHRGEAPDKRAAPAPTQRRVCRCKTRPHDRNATLRDPLGLSAHAVRMPSCGGRAAHAQAPQQRPNESAKSRITVSASSRRRTQHRRRAVPDYDGRGETPSTTGEDLAVDSAHPSFAALSRDGVPRAPAHRRDRRWRSSATSSRSAPHLRLQRRRKFEHRLRADVPARFGPFPERRTLCVVGSSWRGAQSGSGVRRRLGHRRHQRSRSSIATTLGTNERCRFARRICSEPTTCFTESAPTRERTTSRATKRGRSEAGPGFDRESAVHGAERRDGEPCGRPRRHVRAKELLLLESSSCSHRRSVRHPAPARLFDGGYTTLFDNATITRRLAARSPS